MRHDRCHSGSRTLRTVMSIFLLWIISNTKVVNRTPHRDRNGLGNDPRWVSVFFHPLLLDVPRTAMEQVRTCGFKRKSSGLDKAPKMRDSLRLSSFESFSKTWGMYFCAVSRSSVFCS